uniref:RING-type E3 ubiquitin transferase n=1 Tax=Callorhinchus milii TaxID=7868 RepID=A0A4W3GHW5_CALMI
MASRLQAEIWTEEIICPVCLDFFTDPVSLGCGHNFCRSCVTRSWEKQEKNCCAVCQETFPEKHLTSSWALASLAEKARKLCLNPTQMADNLQCEKHREQLKLFCETDKKLICYICRDAKEHRGHSFLPIDEAAEIYKVMMRSRRIYFVSASGFHIKHFYSVRLFQDQTKSSLASLTQRKETALQSAAKQKEKISQVKEHVNSLQTHVTAEFAKMHQSLTDREQRVMGDLRQREEEILKRMEANLREIQCKLDSVEQQLSELTTHLGKDDLTFLQEEAAGNRRYEKIFTKHSRIEPKYQPQGAVSLYNLIVSYFRISDKGFVLSLCEDELPVGIYKGPVHYTAWRQMIHGISPGKCLPFSP